MAFAVTSAKGDWLEAANRRVVHDFACPHKRFDARKQWMSKVQHDPHAPDAVVAGGPEDAAEERPRAAGGGAHHWAATVSIGNASFASRALLCAFLGGTFWDGITATQRSCKEQKQNGEQGEGGH